MGAVVFAVDLHNSFLLHDRLISRRSLLSGARPHGPAPRASGRTPCLPSRGQPGPSPPSLAGPHDTFLCNNHRPARTKAQRRLLSPASRLNGWTPLTSSGMVCASSTPPAWIISLVCWTWPRRLRLVTCAPPVPLRTASSSAGTQGVIFVFVLAVPLHDGTALTPPRKSRLTLGQPAAHPPPRSVPWPRNAGQRRGLASSPPRRHH